MDPINDLEPIEQEDGSALIPEIEEEAAPESNHFSNLAESMDEFKLNSMATDLLELVEKDKEARKKRDEQQEEGIRRTGLGDDAPGGATFDGASKVVHPVLAEGCVDFSARAMKEIFPAKGPVKTKIFGVQDSKKLDKAKRKRDFLNWQLTNEIEEYRAEKEILLTQLPLGGSQYEKYWYDPTLGRIRMEFVPVDEVYLPYAATSFYTSPRATHEQKLTRHVFEERVRSGFYRDIDNLVTEGDPEESASAQATNKIEGKTASGYNEDGVRIVYEVTCYQELDGDVPQPCVVHIDEASGKILAIYRNWNEGDEKAKKLDWWVEDKFIPWRGAYGIGLLHLIGSLAGSLTGALRALIDSAHINNAPTAIKLKGGRASGQNTSIDVTAVQEIEAPAGTDDIRKVIMPMPFNPPSPVLFQLMDWLTNQAKGVVASAEEKIADATSNMPVGTALALIEQGSQVFSSIHARLHASQARALAIICRLNFQYPNHEAMARFGVVPEDFKDNDDVEPVSDPNIFSESQRYAQFQAVLQLAAQGAQTGVSYNLPEVHRWGLELLKVDNVDTILPKPPEPFTGDPVSENREALFGKPLKATPEQDHIAHLQEHLRCLMDPLLGGNPMFPGPLLQNILANCAQHVLYIYSASAMTMGMQEMQLQGGASEKAIADGAANAMQFLQQKFPQLAQQLAQAQQLVASKMPQPPQDPAVAATLQAAMAETERRKAVDAQTFQLKQQEMQRTAQIDSIRLQMEQSKDQFDRMMAQMEQSSKDRSAELEAQLKLLINKQDNDVHQMTELLKNRDDNDTQIVIEQMRQQLASMQDSVNQAVEGRANGFDIEPVMKQLQSMLDSSQKAAESNHHQEVQKGILEGMHGIMQHLSSPKMIIHDENGKPIGVGHAQQTAAVGVK